MFDDDSGAGWKRDVRDIDGEVLCGERLGLYVSPVEAEVGSISVYVTGFFQRV